MTKNKVNEEMTTTTVRIPSYLNWWHDVKYEHLVAGVSGGVMSTILLHPLDLIKIRFTVNDNRMISVPIYRGITNALSTIFKEEGLVGLYRGVTPNIWGAGSAWGLYFLFYNSIKCNLQEGDSSKVLSAGTHLLAATQSGVMTLVLTNPFWVVKTRLCLQYSDQTLLNSQANVKYTSMFDAFAKIYKSEGLKGYYRGFLPGLLGVSHGAVQFMTYEELKNKYNQYRNLPINTKLSTAEYLSFAAASKLIAVTVTYPYQVIRTRLQNQHYNYSGVTDCFTQTWKYEGWKGFYKGLGTNLIRVTPATMITFLTYEKVSQFLINRKS